MRIQSGSDVLDRSNMQRTAGTTAATRIGRVIGTVAVAFLIVDALGKLLSVQPVIEGTARLGYDTDVVFGLGVTLSSCLLLYLFPRTSVLGAMLLTGYLGGAVATHVRMGSPLFTHVLFPAYLGALLWGSLVLRDARLRALISRDAGSHR